jgi:hypothetical protein
MALDPLFFLSVRVLNLRGLAIEFKGTVPGHKEKGSEREEESRGEGTENVLFAREASGATADPRHDLIVDVHTTVRTPAEGLPATQ